MVELFDDSLAAARRRARFYGVPRDLGTLPEAVRPAESPLLEAARPVLERLAPAAGTALLLADSACRTLWSVRDGEVDELCHDLSEQAVGHNSVALAARTGRRAVVTGAEHHLVLWHGSVAVSVPVRDPLTGRVAGTVTVAVGAGEPPAVALAEAAALAVESELHRRAGSDERVLLDAYLRECPASRAVVALDGRNRLVSAEAADLLSEDELAGLEREAMRMVRHGDGDGDRSGAGRPATAGADVRLRPVRRSGEVVGAIAVLDRAGAPVPSSVPAAPGLGRLAGTSVPWRAAVARAAELTASGPLLIAGEPGVGKAALARALGAGAEPVVLDAAGTTADEQRRWLDTLETGGASGPVLLRHAEVLDLSVAAGLVTYLTERPAARIAATYTPGGPTSPCLGRLLGHLAARTVTVPPLRDRPEDVPVLLRALAPRPAPGHPPLTWTLQARRVLEQHIWPGNVAELALLVRRLAEGRRRTGPVRREELPDTVRDTPGERRLSSLERAERAAILEALRTHGGNKLRAAQALGIARATVYRKMRSYGI